MIVDIINKKRLGLELTYKELSFFFNGYLKGDVEDYQMSSLLMAICINGMTDEEIFSLTKILEIYLIFQRYQELKLINILQVVLVIKLL